MTRMTSKGQVTIPKRIRDELGLKAGCDIDFEPTASGGILLRPNGRARRKKSRFAKLRGIRKTGMTTDQWMEFLRGE